jgi:uncharacterized DUF497 family protein
MMSPHQFAWDENKRREIIDTRGIDILEAALIFEGPVLTAIDDRMDYGEVRLRSIGMVDGQTYIVIHTERADVTRIITAWKGSARDQRRYQASIAARHPQDEG